VGVKQGRVINGADDNASGSAALLGLAKRLTEIKPIHTIVFVWFTGEERGLIGSRYYTEKPHNGRLPVFMLNLDMIGHLSDEIPDRKVTQPDKVLAPLFEKYPFAERITFKGKRGASDHSPFLDKNVASIMLHTGLHKHYHRSTDDTDTLDYFGMAEVCDYAHDIILAVAGEVPEYILGEEN
jgi:Zn-dependent M28 family amino/carboxypeptidase